MDIFGYIAKNNPQGTIALLKAYNYKPTNKPEVNAQMMRQLTSTYKNSEYFQKLKQHLTEIHPDKSFIMDYSVVPTFPSSEKKVTVEETHNCDGGGCKCGGKCGGSKLNMDASAPVSNGDAPNTPSQPTTKPTSPITTTGDSVIISKQTLINIVGLLAFGAIIIHFAHAKN